MKRKKKEEYKENQITAMNIFNFTFYIKNYILLKVVPAIAFYLQLSWVTGYLKHTTAQYTQI